MKEVKNKNKKKNQNRKKALTTKTNTEKQSNSTAKKNSNDKINNISNNSNNKNKTVEINKEEIKNKTSNGDNSKRKINNNRQSDTKVDTQNVAESSKEQSEAKTEKTKVEISDIISDSPKKKLSKLEKREKKIKKRNDLLNLRGPNKFITVLIMEIIYIFAVEIMTKVLLDNFSWDYSLLRIFISSGIFSLIITAITTNMPTTLRRIILIVFNFFIVFYAWLQLGFVNFLGTFMSIGNAEQGTKITSYILEFLFAYKPILHLIYIPFIVTILYLIFERRITKDGFAKKFPFNSILCDITLIVYASLLVFSFMVTIETKAMQNKFQTISNKQLLKYPSNPSLTIKNFGTTMYFVLDVKGTLLGSVEEENYTASHNTDKMQVPSDISRKIDDTAWKELIDKETNESMKSLNNYFINREISPTNDYTGMFKDKNLIMIMMESVSEAVFHEEYKEYFPTLYKLYNEGITGVNNYSPKNNCATGESEMTSQIGLYSIETTCTVNTYKKNEYKEALLYMLRKNDYYTSAFHDYTDQYYSRSTFEYNFGAYKYYGVTDLGMSYEYEYKEWPSDLTFVEKALPKILDNEKFAAYLVTVTAHTPYIYSSKMGDKNLSLFKNSGLPTTTKRYLSKVKELDLAMEYMLKTLEEQGKLKDTVIVLFGDHYPYGLGKDYAKLAPYDTKTNQEVDRTPFIIYNSETPSEKIEKYTTPVDYTPTLLNLFGIDFDPRLYMGHDIFSDYDDYAVFPDNSWQSPDGFYDSSKGEFIPNDENTVINDEDIIKINSEINSMRNMSSLAIKKNYFKYLFSHFEEYKKNHSEESTESSEESKDTEE